MVQFKPALQYDKSKMVAPRRRLQDIRSLLYVFIQKTENEGLKWRTMIANNDRFITNLVIEGLREI